MPIDKQERFKTTVSMEAVYQQRLIAQDLADADESEYPDNTYEEGVLDTLNWLIGAGHAAPLDIDLYQDLLNKEND